MVAYWNGTASETIQEVLDGYKTTFNTTTLDATNLTGTIFNNQTTMRVGDVWTMYNSTSSLTLMTWANSTSVLSIGDTGVTLAIGTNVSIEDSTTWTCGGDWTLAGSHAGNLLRWNDPTNTFTIGSSTTPTSFETPTDNLEWSNSSTTAATGTTDPIIATRGWTLNQLQAVVAASATYADFVTNVAAL